MLSIRNRIRIRFSPLETNIKYVLKKENFKIPPKLVYFVTDKSEVGSIQMTGDSASNGETPSGGEFN